MNPGGRKIKQSCFSIALLRDLIQIFCGSQRSSDITLTVGASMGDLKKDIDCLEWTLISVGVHPFVAPHKLCRLNVASVTEEMFIVNKLGVKSQPNLTPKDWLQHSSNSQNPKTPDYLC